MYKGVKVLVIIVNYSENESENRKKKDKDIKFLCNLARCGDSIYISKFHGWCFYETNIKIVMERVSNKISDYFEPHKKINYKFSLKQKIKILLEAAKGLAFLHKNGIIHTQFKSRNIALNKVLEEPNDLDFTVKFFEFELFKGDQGGHCYQSGQAKYNSPEHSGDKFTNKSDIFQFAMFVFELFTLRESYTDKTTMKLNDTQICKRTKEDNLRPDTKHECDDDCPPVIIELYKKCWSLKKENRLNTKELVEILGEFYEKIE